jgi:hypothetical protein
LELEVLVFARTAVPADPPPVPAVSPLLPLTDPTAVPAFADTPLLPSTVPALEPLAGEPLSPTVAPLDVPVLATTVPLEPAPAPVVLTVPLDPTLVDVPVVAEPLDAPLAAVLPEPPETRPPSAPTKSNRM